MFEVCFSASLWHWLLMWVYRLQRYDI